MGSSEQSSPAVPGGLFRELLAAVDAEIDAAERDSARRTEVTDGRRVHRSIGGALYSFTIDSSFPFLPETPVELHRGSDRCRGVVVAVDDFGILVQLREDLGATIDDASLASEPGFILASLRDRLTSLSASAELTQGIAAGISGSASLATGIEKEVAAAAGTALEQIGDVSLIPNVAQLRAMARVAGSQLHFVWGPPGTGKTANLAQIARMLVDAGERLLVVAHANVAVDVAMLRVADAFAGTPHLAAGKIVRAGAPHHPEAARRDELLVEGAVARRDPEGMLERRTLEESRRRLAAEMRNSSDELERDAMAAELEKVRSRLRELVDQHRRVADDVVREAWVVGTTLSRLVLSDVLWELHPDALLLDEASMASVPWVLAAATRPRKRLVVLGDFRQLPPVYISQKDVAREWLGRDAFDLAGVRQNIDLGREDERVTMLDTQYRMAKPIGEAISNLAYDGKLHPDRIAAERAGAFSAGQPHPGEALLLVDTSALQSACQVEAQSGSFSRINPVHALLALSLARVLATSHALISPYRAQARLLAAGVRDFEIAESSAATVHRFQGSERNAVILDLVDSHPQTGSSRLTGSDVDLALRLANVGLSRARGKAIVVADVAFIEERFAPNAPVRRVLDLCRNHGNMISPQPIDLAEAFDQTGIDWSDDWAQLVHTLIADIDHAERSVVINVPTGVGTPAELAIAIAAAAGRGVRVVAIGPPTLLSSLEAAPAELRLLTEPGFFACVDHARAYVGGREPAISARVVSDSLPRLLESLLIRESPRSPTEIGKADSELPSGLPELPPGKGR
jgi:hypothetical protein